MEQKQNVEQGAGGKGLDDYLRAGSPGVLITVCALLLVALGGLFAPAFTRAFTDDILTSNRLSWYPGILYAFANGLSKWYCVIAKFHCNENVSAMSSVLLDFVYTGITSWS